MVQEDEGSRWVDVYRTQLWQPSDRERLATVLAWFPVLRLILDSVMGIEANIVAAQHWPS